MKSFYVSSKNVVTNDELNNEYPAIMPKKIYYGTGDGFVQIKRAYFPFGNNKAKIVYRKDKVGYINKYINNVLNIIYNSPEGYSYIINTNNSDGYIWISNNNYGNIKTECDYIYLYSNSSNFFNSATYDINIEKLGFNYVTNLVNFGSQSSQNSLEIKGYINKINCLNVVNAAYSFYAFYGISGNPCAMPKVIDMNHTYAGSSITGTPYCGPLTYYFQDAYRDCYGLNGKPVCGENVFNFTNTYYNCSNLNGELVCGPHVNSMYQTYYQCYKCKYASNLHFYGNNCTQAFYQISGTYGNFYFHNITNNKNFYYAFYNREIGTSSFNKISVYINHSLNLDYYNIRNLFGISPAMTAITNGVFNLQYNVYVYNNL